MNGDKDKVIDNEHRFLVSINSGGEELRASVNERLQDVGGGDPLLSLGAWALLGNGWRTCGLDTVQSSCRAAER